MLSFLKNIAKDLLSIVYPDLCLCCLEEEKFKTGHFCLACQSEIPYISDQQATTAALIGKVALPKTITGTFALMYYYKESISQKVLHQIKYKNNPELAIALGKELGLKNVDFLPKTAILIPIPLHPKRKHKRGYNQSYKIAQGIAETTQLEVDNTILRRVINNPSQTKRSLTERQQLMRDTYVVNKSKNIETAILVDDVITTGSTLAACYQLLEEMGVSKVYIATVAITV